MNNKQHVYQDMDGAVAINLTIIESLCQRLLITSPLWSSPQTNTPDHTTQFRFFLSDFKLESYHHDTNLQLSVSLSNLSATIKGESTSSSAQLARLTFVTNLVPVDNEEQDQIYLSINNDLTFSNPPTLFDDTLLNETAALAIHQYMNDLVGSVLNVDLLALDENLNNVPNNNIATFNWLAPVFKHYVLVQEPLPYVVVYFQDAVLASQPRANKQGRDWPYITKGIDLSLFFGAKLLLMKVLLPAFKYMIDPFCYANPQDSKNDDQRFVELFDLASGNALNPNGLRATNRKSLLPLKTFFDQDAKLRLLGIINQGDLIVEVMDERIRLDCTFSCRVDEHADVRFHHMYEYSLTIENNKLNIHIENFTYKSNAVVYKPYPVDPSARWYKKVEKMVREHYEFIENSRVLLSFAEYFLPNHSHAPRANQEQEGTNAWGAHPLNVPASEGAFQIDIIYCDEPVFIGDALPAIVKNAERFSHNPILGSISPPKGEIKEVTVTRSPDIQYKIKNTEFNGAMYDLATLASQKELSQAIGSNMLRSFMTSIYAQGILPMTSGYVLGPLLNTFVVLPNFFKFAHETVAALVTQSTYGSEYIDGKKEWMLISESFFDCIKRSIIPFANQTHNTISHGYLARGGLVMDMKYELHSPPRLKSTAMKKVDVYAKAEFEAIKASIQHQERQNTYNYTTDEDIDLDIYQFNTTRDAVIETPLMRSETFSTRFRAEIYFKREDLQCTRSAMFRGAYTALKHSNGTKSVYAGPNSHLTALACAAYLRGKKVHLFLPETAASYQVSELETIGGKFVEISLSGQTPQESLENARRFTKEGGFNYFDPLSSLSIEGLTALGKELSIDPPLDYLFLPIAYGSILSGIVQEFKKQRLSTKIIGVETSGMPMFYAARLNNHPLTLDKTDTFANEGSPYMRINESVFSQCNGHLHDVVLVSNFHICNALWAIYEAEGIMLDLPGAMAIAALDYYKESIEGKKIAVLLSAANTEEHRLPLIKEMAYVDRGLKFYLELITPSSPSHNLLNPIIERYGAEITYLHPLNRIGHYVTTIGLQSTDYLDNSLPYRLSYELASMENAQCSVIMDNDLFELLRSIC